MLFVPKSTMVCRRKLRFSVLCKLRIECINVCLDLRNECLQSQRRKDDPKEIERSCPASPMTWRFSEVGIKLRLETLSPNERAKSNDRLLFDL
jgi:hypothetical protein